MQKVFVLNKNKQPLMPCSSKRAREFLNQGKVVVVKCHPFTILLKEREKGDSQEIELKLNGFKTGNLVKANVAQGKKKGRYFGRVAVRSSGNFCIDTTSGKVDSINHKYCKTIQSADGHNYSTKKTKKKEQHFLPALKGEVSMLSRG